MDPSPTPPQFSSSSDLPSPSTFFQRKKTPVLPSGSRASAIPNGAISGFATAGALLRDNVLNLEYPAEEPVANRKASKSRNSRSEATGKKKTKSTSANTAKRRLKKTAEQVAEPSLDAETAARNEQSIDDSSVSVTCQVLAPSPEASVCDVSDFPSALLQQDHGGSEVEVSAHITLANRPTARASDISIYDVPDSPKELSPQQNGEGDLQDEVSITVADKKTARSRKPRASNAASESAGLQPKNAAPRKQKKQPNRNSDGKAKSKPTGKVSHHFATREETPPAMAHDDALDESLKLEPALKRRTDWTPVKDTFARRPSLAAAGPDETCPIATAVNRSLSEVLLDYSYANENALSEAGQTGENRRESGESFTKRRRIEFVDLPGDSNTCLPDSVTVERKRKSPKKKATTITDIATAQYRQPNNNCDTGPTSDFFNPLTEAVQLKQPKSPTKKSRSSDLAASKATKKQSSKRQKKPATKDSKKKKPTLVIPKLLSPESAVARMNKQDILFGTSSQLAQPESPTFIRALQQSMLDANSQSTEMEEPVLKSTSLVSIKGAKGLWTAAARDHEDGLLAAGFQKSPSAKSGSTTDEGDQCLMLHADSLVEFADQTEVQIAQQEDATAESHANQVTSPQTPDLSWHTAPADEFQNIDDIASEEDLPPPSIDRGFCKIDDVQLDSFVLPIRNSSPLRGEDCEMMSPSPRRFQTTDRLALSPIPANLGSPPKQPQKTLSHTNSPRPTPLTKRLEECRQLHIESTPRTPSKLHKDAPTKDWTHIDEIEDSEPDFTPSPPRATKQSRRRRSLQLSPSKKSPSKPTEAALKDWATVSATLFPKITTCVKSAPQTTDPAKPSWHEKMLLYDPIPVEDFTGWLNERGLTAPGKKGVEAKLEPWMVQKWCESKSVCCFMESITSKRKKTRARA